MYHLQSTSRVLYIYGNEKKKINILYVVQLASFVSKVKIAGKKNGGCTITKNKTRCLTDLGIELN
jgi:hypothetical protein